MFQQNGEFNWDEQTQGIVLGAFFYGYVLTQVPGGRLAELFGGKLVYGIGVLITAIFTLLTPIAARINFPLFIAVRVLEGMGEVSISLNTLYFSISWTLITDSRFNRRAKTQKIHQVSNVKFFLPQSTVIRMQK